MRRAIQLLYVSRVMLCGMRVMLCGMRVMLWV